jgi:outer membrane lipoprotein carrier protein
MLWVKKLLLLITSSLIACQYSFAQTPSDELINLLSQMQSISADFSQTLVNKTMANKATTGIMILQRPGKLRWEVLQPNKQTVISNGQKLWIYDVDLEQVTIRLLTKQMGETPVWLLSNANPKLTNYFNVTKLNRPQDNLQWYLLKPKKSESIFTAIALGFTRDKQIAAMRLQDNLGHTTLTTFSHIILNPKVSASTFDFTPPSHVDVIDETH